MRSVLIPILAALLASAACFPQGQPAKLAVGMPAPEFSLPYANRDSIGDGELALSSFLGRSDVVLAFYPASWSAGCTREVCTFRDNFDSIAVLEAEVLAISGDYPYTQHEWAKHHNLPFTLLSDHRHRVASRYGSFNDATGYTRRTVWVVDRTGTIAYIDTVYSTRDLASFMKLRDALARMRSDASR